MIKQLQELHSIQLKIMRNFMKKSRTVTCSQIGRDIKESRQSVHKALLALIEKGLVFKLNHNGSEQFFTHPIFHSTDMIQFLRVQMIPILKEMHKNMLTVAPDGSLFDIVKSKRNSIIFLIELFKDDILDLK